MKRDLIHTASSLPHIWLTKTLLKSRRSVNLYVVSNYIKTLIYIFKSHQYNFWSIWISHVFTYICRTCNDWNRIINITPKLQWASPALFAIEFFFPAKIFTPDTIRNNYYFSKLQSGSRFHCAKCWVFRRDSPCSKEAASLRDRKTESRWGNVI